MRALSMILSLAVLLAVVALPGRAETEKTPKQQHPLLVLYATFDQEGLNSARAVRGNCTIWLKNISDVPVDGVKVTLKLMEGGRMVKTMDKQVGNVDAGKKTYLEYKWEEYTTKKLKPQIWVTYNGANGPVTFRTEPPNW